MICVIPCYQRPEFLYHCLERIKKAYGADEIEYLFMVDFGYSAKVKQLVEEFPFKKRVHFQSSVSYRLAKQSYNVLRGYQIAVQAGARYIFMIEEDVMIATDFFEWHLKVHSMETLFCSIASRNNNSKVETSNSLDNYYLIHGDYQSLGVCFDSYVLTHCVLPHADKPYYHAPLEYCAKVFPNSKIGRFFAEQDGLIRRAQELESDLPVAFPDVPRAFHAGFYGKNRGNKKQGTYEHLRDKVGNTIFDNQKMKAAVDRPEFYDDSTPVNLENPHINYPLNDCTIGKVERNA